jgi:hypothetical protein
MRMHDELVAKTKRAFQNAQLVGVRVRESACSQAIEQTLVASGPEGGLATVRRDQPYQDSERGKGGVDVLKERLGSIDHGDLKCRDGVIGSIRVWVQYASRRDHLEVSRAKALDVFCETRCRELSAREPTTAET